MVLRMDNGCAGFFSNEDLAQGRGVIRSKDELKILENAKKQTFTPLLNCDKKQFERLCASLAPGIGYFTDGSSKPILARREQASTSQLTTIYRTDQTCSSLPLQYMSKSGI